MRRAGILLHLSSLPSPYGIGTMGQEARAFVDFLQAAGQSDWQLLPLGPTGYGDSPYQSFSSFAGNVYFIDLDTLADEGLLLREEYQAIDWESPPDAVNYGALYKKRIPLLRTACRRLLDHPPADFGAFCKTQTQWLPDYALFMALKDAHGGASWQDWAQPVRTREPAAIRAFSADHESDLAFWKAAQYLFFRQWTALRAYAHSRGVSIIGDMPIYVAADSADVWSQPEQFQLDSDLRPIQVAGCPPDGFTADGQLWGNPLFDWDAMERDGFRWWRRRVAHQRKLCDVLRIDHFRGLESYYAIPGGAETAKTGVWRQGPGKKLIAAIQEVAGDGGMIAEDLGYLTDEVRSLLRESGFPGMKVLEFAFDSRENGDYLPHNYPRHCVVYSGTHDNSTALGWIQNAPPADVAMARAYLGLSEQEGLGWGLLRGVWSSVGNLAIVQMQDVLNLDDRARMNIPATCGQNWRWRMLPGAATAALAKTLHEKMALFHRLPEQGTKILGNPRP